MLRHFIQGWQRFFACLRLLVPFYVANLVLALMSLAPLYMLLQDAVGPSNIGFIPAGLDNMYFLSDLFHHHRGGLVGWAGAVLVGAVFHLVSSLFLAGGALNVLVEPEQRYTPAHFWGGAGTWFGPFLRLQLWSLPILIVLLAIPVMVQSQIVSRVGGDAPLGSFLFRADVALAGALLIALFLYMSLVEYGRALMVAGRNKVSRKALFQSLKLLATRPLRSMGLNLAFMIPAALILLGHQRLQLPAGPSLGLLLVAQLYILLRHSFRLSRYGAQLALVASEAPRPAPIKGYTLSESELDEQPRPQVEPEAHEQDEVVAQPEAELVEEEQPPKL